VNPKTIFIITAGVQALYGVSLLLFPQFVLELYAINQADTLFPQLFGGALIAFAVINWIVRNYNAGGIYGRPIVAGNMTFFLIGFLLFAGLLVRDANSPVWWINLLISLIFGICFILLLFGKIKSGSPQ
jgi:hypothetical protein